ESVVNHQPVINRCLIAEADQADSFTDEIKSSRGRLDVDRLHCIRLVNDPSNAAKHRVSQLVVFDKCMKRTMSTMMREADVRYVKWFRIGRDLSTVWNENEFGF